jgi:putative aminopeptidase FrvX
MPSAARKFRQSATPFHTSRGSRLRGRWRPSSAGRSQNVLVIGVECSKAITGVALGGGPVLRVGDKATVFTPAVTAYCQVVAEELAAKDKAFSFQRKLMDGGTCESTAYCHYGYDATGICLPLGNYHNMDESRGRIGPEYIDVRDFANLVKWFVALAPARPSALRRPASRTRSAVDALPNNIEVDC